MKEKWILFSYSIPAANAKARMRIWRRISATGAAQLKTGLQILPNRDELRENITWLIGEVNSLGGEAIALQCAQVEGISDMEIQRLFQRQLDPEFTRIQTEAREMIATSELGQSNGWLKEQAAALRKLRKRCESLRERDFFPSGAAATTLSLLDIAGEKLRNPEACVSPQPKLDLSAYQGRTWVTRAHPYIDRLSSAWLILRFIDANANVLFLQPGDKAEESFIAFDMAEGAFSHQGELITFEVIARDFGLFTEPVAKIGELVKYIDVQETVLPDDAALLKNLLDGLIALSINDQQLLERALLLFDALQAGFTTGFQEKRS